MNYAAPTFASALLATRDHGAHSRPLFVPSIVRESFPRWSSARSPVTNAVALDALPASRQTGRRCGGCVTFSTLALSMLIAQRRIKRSGELRRKKTSVAAFEDEIGVQPPLGFWDPMGFTDVDNFQQYKRRRSVEIKHGRIAMLATMGYMTPEIVGKWPGYLSPSLGLKFADVPNGWGALSKVPPLGWAQILVYFGFVEFSAGFEDYTTGTPGDYGWKLLTSDDPVEKKKKLNAELANGRLAMVAVMAMLFQNGVAGTTGPEMWIPGLQTQ